MRGALSAQRVRPPGRLNRQPASRATSAIASVVCATSAGDLFGISVFGHDRSPRCPRAASSPARAAAAVVACAGRYRCRRDDPQPGAAGKRRSGQLGPYDSWGRAANPLPAMLAGLGLKRAARAGVKGVVLVWRGVSAANARRRCVPFTLSYRGTPAVFVAGQAADPVLHAAQRGAPQDQRGRQTPRSPVEEVTVAPHADPKARWSPRVVEGASEVVTATRHIRFRHIPALAPWPEALWER